VNHILKKEMQMRELTLITATALITALITVWSMHALGTGAPAKTTAASASMSVMQMMKESKNLPEQSFDTH
jgi:hypothetical protein